MNITRFVKTAALVLLTSIFYQTARAQSVAPTRTDSLHNTRAQSIYFELFGPGITFSANYDTRFSQKRDGFGGRAGVGFLAIGGSSFVSVPFQVNYLLGKANRYLEIGLGATYVSYTGTGFFSFDNTPTTTHNVLGTMTFGYRYQPVDGGFNFRASFNPLFDSSTFYPFVGISVGYTF